MLLNFWHIILQVYFEPDEVHACIVTCGGLCPGLNTVIREIVCGLYHMYGVDKILGIDVSDHVYTYSSTLYSYGSAWHTFVSDITCMLISGVNIACAWH